MTDSGLHDELKIPSQLQHLVQRPLMHQLKKSPFFPGNAVEGFLLLEFNHLIYRCEIELTERERMDATSVTDLYSRKIQKGIRVIAERIKPAIEELKMTLPDDTERYNHDA